MLVVWNMALKFDCVRLARVSRKVFRFLDTNRNGKVSKEEWRVGVELLNRRLPPGQHLSVDADSLFAVLDLDGSGELELDEFSAAFTAVVVAA